jgi:hypothetical protein
MALSDIQREVMEIIAENRSASSYLAGGTVLNRNWTRMSDDIDIFHDTDEEIGQSADRDIALLVANDFDVRVVVDVYGCVEAEVTKHNKSTIIQWMSESRVRFFPLVRDAEWGARLHPADLAVNKILAASSRSKARDFVDLVEIDSSFCPLGVLVMAASGKPPHYSPQRMIEEMRRRGLSISNGDYEAVRRNGAVWNAHDMRAKLEVALDKAEAYVRTAPPESIGLLPVDSNEVPVPVLGKAREEAIFRRATAEHEVMPQAIDPA